jgi:hypothetical protein
MGMAVNFSWTLERHVQEDSSLQLADTPHVVENQGNLIIIVTCLRKC